MAFYYTCPHCNSNLDPGEKCECQKEQDPKHETDQEIKVEADQIPQPEIDRIALPLLRFAQQVQKKFEDPAVQADFERWQADRMSRPTG